MINLNSHIGMALIKGDGQTARLNKYELEHTAIELEFPKEACRDDPDKSISLYSIYRQLGVELMKIL